MNISSALQTGVSQSAAKISKYSPQLLTGVGIIGLIAAGVVAAKQTLKLEETLDTSNARLENVKHHVEEGNATQKDVNKAVVQNTVDLVKLYWVPVTIGVASTTLILVGHSILHKRNVALIGAYATLQEAYNNYRARVVEEYGVEADEKFRYGFRDTVEVDEKGKKTTVRTGRQLFEQLYLLVRSGESRVSSENSTWSSSVLRVAETRIWSSLGTRRSVLTSR